jgi:uncharacterized protein YcbK (DUF882 family)
MAVKTYKYNANVQLTKNFNSNEFQCKGKGHKHDTKIDTELVKKLQDFMNINGYTKAIISSGYRCKEHNKVVGGASGSNHCKGKAVDICFYKGDKKVLAKEVCCKAQDYGFKGIAYIDKYHVHLDNRSIGKYRGDERKGYSNNVPNGDFYKYFGIDRYNLTRVLKKGCKGDDVKELQKTLNNLGYNSGTVDGIFGEKTKTAVENFQIVRGLTKDDCVGKATAHELGWTFKGK